MRAPNKSLGFVQIAGVIFLGVNIQVKTPFKFKFVRSKVNNSVKSRQGSMTKQGGGWLVAGILACIGMGALHMADLDLAAVGGQGHGLRGLLVCVNFASTFSSHVVARCASTDTRERTDYARYS